MLGCHSRQALLGCCPSLTFESVGPVGPVVTLPPCDNVMGLFPIVPVGELSSVDPVRRAPVGLVSVVWREFPDGREPVSTQLPAEVLVGDYRDVVDMDVTVDSQVEDRAVVAMVGFDAILMGEDTQWTMRASVRSGIFVTSLKQSMACLFIMVVICVMQINQIGRILETLRMRSMWICATLMPQKEWD